MEAPMQDSFRATALPISAATLLSMLGIGMLVPALPQLAAATGSSVLAAGGLIGAYGLARLLCNALSGVLIDRYGISRSAYAGLLLLAADSVYGFNAASFAALFAAMAIQGAASSLFSTAAMTALLIKAGPKSRGRAMAWFQTSLLLGFAIGPVIGGQVVDRIGAHAPFLIQAAIALFAMVSVRAMPSSTAAGARPGTSPIGPGSIISSTLVIGGLGGLAAFFCRFGVAWQLVPVLALQQFHLSNGELGAIIGAGTLANVAVTPFLGRLVDGWGALQSFVSASLLNVAGLLALYFAPWHSMLWVATAIVLFATGVMIPSAAALALRKVAPPAMGRATGLFRTIGEAGMALGPVVVPAVSAALHLPVLAGLLTCAVVTIAALGAALAGSARRSSDGRTGRTPVGS
jgi:MFS family permease